MSLQGASMARPAVPGRPGRAPGACCLALSGGSGAPLGRLAARGRRQCAQVVNSTRTARRAPQAAAAAAAGAGRSLPAPRRAAGGAPGAAAWSPRSPGPRPAGPHISACVARHGRRIIICAALAGVADSATSSSSNNNNGGSSSNGGGAAGADLASLLSERVKLNGQLVTGQLDNGLRYVLLPNPTPPERFEAHLEVHVGSVDERGDEQGLAHLVEHVTFLGSKRRESLLGTGARANAYTDFHHTVFHVHAPLTNYITGSPMLPQVLGALAEIAFEPQFAEMRVEKERKAVLAEAQMMNTIEYRIDCQLLTHLHAENNLGSRFPIGKTEQVKAWGHAMVQGFWRKWYFPANATLYIVGELDRSEAEVIELVEKAFGKYAPGRLDDHGPGALGALPAGGAAPEGLLAGGTADAAAAPPAAVVPDELAEAAAVAPAPGQPWAGRVVINGDGDLVLGEGVIAAAPDGRKLRHPVRPPVLHRHGCGPMQPGEPRVPVSIFRHPLLQHFMLTVFCKMPVTPLKAMGDLKYSFMVRVILSSFQFRINQRYVVADPPFIGIDLDISDSGREGCTVSTLTITAQPAHWHETVQVAVEEARRLQRYGLTPSELERYVLAMMRDSAQLAEQANSVPSINSLDFVMESLALGHTVMSHGEAHDAMTQVARTISLEDVNAVAASLLSFASDVGREEEMLELAARPDQQGKWGGPGPTRATSVVACMPAFISGKGEAVLVGGSLAADHSRAGMGASGHIDADQVDLEELEAQGRQVEELLEMEAPEGALEFFVDEEEILEALASPDLEVEPLPDVELPEHLVDPARVEEAVAALQPRFVPLEGDLELWAAAPPSELDEAACCPPTDEDTGITQRRLSNGIRINYRHTDNEPKAGLLRIVAAGGRASESRELGPGGVGAVGVGTRTLSEGGGAGKWSREQVEAFCIANLIQSVMDSNDEFFVIDVHFAATNGGLRCAFEVVHECLTAPDWDESAFERSKLAFLNSGESVEKSLERASSSRVMEAMLGPDMRFRDPTPEMLQQLTLDGVRGALEAQLHPTNLEVSVAGDFDSAELEELVLTYLGTITSPRPPPTREALLGAPLAFQDPPLEQRHITWHLKDSDERASAYVAGPAPCRWGPFGSRAPLTRLAGGPSPPPPPATNPAAAAAATVARRAHPLYPTITLQLLQEVINSRLFTTVRDSLGLTYDVSFEITTYDRLRAGWFSVHVTSYPDKIHEALAASLEVLRDLSRSPVTPRELMRAKRTLVTRHESDLKDNNYWLGLLTHIGSPDVPHKSVGCLRDLKAMYEAATINDLYDAYAHFDFSDEAVFTCVGTSGKAPPPPPDHEALGAMFGGGGEEAAAAAAGAPAGAAQLDWAAVFSQAFGAATAVQQQQQQQQAGAQPNGNGAAQHGAQQQQQQQPVAAAAGQQQQRPDPMAMITAMIAAAQGAKLTQALNKDGAQQQQQQAGSGGSSSGSES